ncbi:MAG: HAD hydrolase-like protein [bacterium]|nr:HAD hydrolase-like protein [bacterium]MCP4963919.1 HAD hydrolase-like protein [bacterium]
MVIGRAGVRTVGLTRDRSSERDGTGTPPIAAGWTNGFQKPDERMFTTALDLLAVDASESLMVGDSMPSDGAATFLGIDTLILPTPFEVSPRGLDAVVRLIR